MGSSEEAPAAGPEVFTPEWVRAFNTALADVAFEVDPGTSLAAGSGQFSIRQIIHGAPSGVINTLISYSEGHLSMELEDPPPEPPMRVDPTDGSEIPAPPAPAAPAADVEMRLDWDSAISMATGELSPARALSEGRIRVRGDLSVLVAAQSVLAAARSHLGALHPSTESG